MLKAKDALGLSRDAREELLDTYEGEITAWTRHLEDDLKPNERLSLLDKILAMRELKVVLLDSLSEREADVAQERERLRGEVQVLRDQLAEARARLRAYEDEAWGEGEGARGAG